MKNKLITICLLAAFSSPLFAQSNNVVERGFACNIKDGFTINDVVCFKGLIGLKTYLQEVAILREPLAVSGDFQKTGTLLWLFTTRHMLMVEKRTAFRQMGFIDFVMLLTVGTELESNVWFALESSGGQFQKSPRQWLLTVN